MKQKSNLQTTVQELLEEAGNDVLDEFFHSRMCEKVSSWDNQEARSFKEKLQGLCITFKHEDNFGGEGQGENYWSVYSFTQGKEKVYVQFDGWYQSYNGSEYTEFFFVEPKEVTRAEFFKV